MPKLVMLRFDRVLEKLKSDDVKGAINEYSTHDDVQAATNEDN